MEISKLKKLVVDTLNLNKAEKIVSIDLKGKTYIADYMIVASGTSSRHIQSLSEILLSTLEKKGVGKFKIEGRSSEGWKLIDAMDIIIHIFHPEKRKFYDLEKMWSEPILNDRINL
ncbi:MAG: ribosome silencing factor [Candidatus Marinimicrobia bacterium]|nr:ribosome silencing factor [Candidatus Neomarinimicrobiota bacterium]RPG04848.1 MAG: ribosome silencing factor [Pelagibacteraceae bacterium TMED247]|tara:strand:+ start:7145 stop:7492 length:348 start_codon:yes stop_codon:yes gene_type:complete